MVSTMPLAIGVSTTATTVRAVAPAYVLADSWLIFPLHPQGWALCVSAFWCTFAESPR
jgi:hypothetical protein